METKSILLLAVSIVLACMQAGCAPTAQMTPETATGLVELRHAMATGKIHLERTVEALEDVEQSPRANTEQQINLFSREMAELEAEVARIRGINNRIQSAADAHYAAWEAELKDIRNPDIAAAGQARHKKTRETLEAIKDKLEEVRFVLKPLMSNLQDINGSLNSDKTAEGVQGIQQPIRDTLAMKADVMRKVNSVIEYIDQVTKSVQ